MYQPTNRFAYVEWGQKYTQIIWSDQQKHYFFRKVFSFLWNFCTRVWKISLLPGRVWRVEGLGRCALTESWAQISPTELKFHPKSDSSKNNSTFCIFWCLSDIMFQAPTWCLWPTLLIGFCSQTFMRQVSKVICIIRPNIWETFWTPNSSFQMIWYSWHYIAQHAKVLCCLQ